LSNTSCNIQNNITGFTGDSRQLQVIKIHINDIKALD